MSRRPPATGSPYSTYQTRSRERGRGAMNEQTACAWCELEIQGSEEWMRSDGRRYHSACLRSWREYRRLTQAAEPAEPPSSSQA